jgi:hypothetical protein
MIKEAEYRKYNQVKFYFGIVNEVLEDYSIRFRIPNIIDNLDDDQYPLAHPILKHTSEIFVSDTVVIMQLDVDFQDFVYFSNDVTEFTGLRFGHDIIDLSLGKEDSPSLSIKVAELKKGDKEEGEEYEVLGPFTDITLSDKSLVITKATPDSDDTSNDKKNVVITIDDKGIDAVVNDGNENKRSHIKVSDQGEITVEATPDGGKSKEELKSNTIDLAAGDTTKISMDDNTPKIEAAAGQTSNITLDGSGVGKVEIKGGESKGTLDGAQGIKLESVLKSSLDLGAQVELKNIVGGLKGLIDDLWTELLQVNTSLSTLAGLCAGIQFTGPGALTNGTAGAQGPIAASMATINAKKALVNTVLK